MKARSPKLLTREKILGYLYEKRINLDAAIDPVLLDPDNRSPEAKSANFKNEFNFLLSQFTTVHYGFKDTSLFSILLDTLTHPNCAIKSIRLGVRTTPAELSQLQTLIQQNTKITEIGLVGFLFKEKRKIDFIHMFLNLLKNTKHLRNFYIFNIGKETAGLIAKEIRRDLISYSHIDILDTSPTHTLATGIISDLRNELTHQPQQSISSGEEVKASPAKKRGNDDNPLETQDPNIKRSRTTRPFTDTQNSSTSYLLECAGLSKRATSSEPSIYDSLMPMPAAPATTPAAPIPAPSVVSAIAPAVAPASPILLALPTPSPITHPLSASFFSRFHSIPGFQSQPSSEVVYRSSN